MNTTVSSPTSKTSPVALLLVWSIVAIPLGWGLAQSLIKSKPLFAGESHTAPVRPAPTAPATP